MKFSISVNWRGEVEAKDEDDAQNVLLDELESGNTTIENVFWENMKIKRLIK